MTDLIGVSLLALAAGALLNLTPCVLPAIPFKIRAISREAGGDVRQRLLAAGAFLAGSLIFFLALGGAAALLQLKWGFLFQSWVFLALLTAFLAVAGAVTLLDVNLPLPQMVYRVRPSRLFEPLLSGALAGLLSTPCTGPFLGGVLASALTLPTPAVLWLFAMIGLGLALPYLLLILWPDLLKHFPNSGEWTARLKEGLGLILLAGAVFFAGSLVPGHWARGAWLAWSAAAVLWAAFAVARSRTLAGKALPLVFATTGAFLVFSWGGAPPESKIPWAPYSPEALQQAQIDKRPVLIEFTADWCINCKVLEQTVYSDRRVLQALRERPLLPLQVDLTRPDASLEALLAGYGGAGLPFAVILAADGTPVRRLPDLFTAGALVDAIRATGTGKE